MGFMQPAISLSKAALLPHLWVQDVSQERSSRGLEYALFTLKKLLLDSVKRHQLNLRDNAVLKWKSEIRISLKQFSNTL
jgi:hypothetical protein